MTTVLHDVTLEESFPFFYIKMLSDYGENEIQCVDVMKMISQALNGDQMTISQKLSS